MRLPFKLLHDLAVVPRVMTPGSACADVYSIGDNTIRSGRQVAVKTGLAFEIPTGFALMVYSRSGHGFKHGMRLANSVGVIDSDYRGELLVCLRNDGDIPITVKHHSRIAQIMLIPVPTIEFVMVEALSETSRGSGGGGSTGT